MTAPSGDLQPGVRVTKIRASEPARRPPHPWIHPCPTCGHRFWTKPWKGRPATYCSDACRQEAYRKRMRHRQDGSDASVATPPQLLTCCDTYRQSNDEEVIFRG